MKVTAKHRLDKAAWRASPHFDARPYAAEPELIVIHCVSLPEGEFGTGHPGALFVGTLDVRAHESFADLEGMQVAPHLLIDRHGGVEQFVEFDKRAWHAGESCWRGRPRCNDFAVGIELEGCVNSAFTSAQYDALVEVISALCERYPRLSFDAVVGHNEIAPGRKTDPGPHFRWRHVLQALASRRWTMDDS